MTIPLNTEHGDNLDLTCPDESDYYTWGGKKTSAQYYVNPLGVGQEEACQWGDGSKPVGNWAPVNLGLGYTNGVAWPAIFQNLPTQPSEHLNFTITLKGDDMDGTCRYQNGQYCGGANFDQCNSNGCTVS